MRIFIKKILLFSLGLLLLLALIANYLTNNNMAAYQFLYKHQITKIEVDTTYINLLVGDSSLGNAIDSKEFSRLSGQSTLNTSLTGLYGYAGSYNMLKVVHKHHPELKNVIIVQTLDMQTRAVSMAGYVRTINSGFDFLELSMKDKSRFLNEYVSYVKSIPLALPSNERAKKISNDYIKQYGIYKPKKTLASFDVKKIKANKNQYLFGIIDYCTAHNLNLVYAHGPLYKGKLAVSADYLDTINERISSTGIALAKTPIAIEHDQIGDSEDHVNPKFKKEYTALFYDLLSEYLIE